MGQTGRNAAHRGDPARSSSRSGWTAGSVLAVSLATAGGALTLAGCGSSVASAASVLQHASHVTVVHPGGGRAAGVAGMSLRPGDEVMVDRGGSATVSTSGRLDYLTPGAALVITDGARQSVQHGEVVVDAEQGPAVTVRSAGYSIDVPAGSATRIVRGVSVTVGSLAGGASVTSGSGARLAVPALAQVMTGGDALPTGTTPLHLSDDRAEAAAVPALVRDDELLRSLARGIDGTGSAATVAVDASWSSGRSAAAVKGVARSDKVLPAVLARSAGAGAAGYRSAIRWRSEGGSWGVIAHLLGVTAAGAAAQLAALEAAPGGIGRISTAALIGAAVGGGHPGATHPHGPGGGSSPPSPSTPTSHGPSPSGSPSPSPSPSSGPVSGTVGKVTKTVHKVLKKLPLPSVSVPAMVSSLLGNALGH